MRESHFSDGVAEKVMDGFFSILLVGNLRADTQPEVFPPLRLCPSLLIFFFLAHIFPSFRKYCRIFQQLHG